MRRLPPSVARLERRAQVALRVGQEAAGEPDRLEVVVRPGRESRVVELVDARILASGVLCLAAAALLAGERVRPLAPASALASAPASA